jgi:hypothetical protein
MTKEGDIFVVCTLELICRKIKIRWVARERFAASMGDLVYVYNIVVRTQILKNYEHKGKN